MLPLYILTGGASRRFGCDKASYLIEGIPWARHVASRLAINGDSTLVGKLSGPPITGIRIIADAGVGKGPLSGVLAALVDRRERLGPGLLVIASCDLVRPDAAWLGPLIACHEHATTIDVAAYQAAGRWQPFPCVAHSRWGNPLRRLLVEGERSWQGALGVSRTAAVPWKISPAGPPQANTPHELAQCTKQ